MTDTMKAVVYYGPWDMRLESLPIPEPREGEVLIRLDAVGICGSDVHGFTGQSGRRAPGMVMGHEAAGRVAAHGPGVQEPAVGEKVTIFNILAETPPSPEEGDPSFLDKQILGVNLGKRGAMAEYIAVPASNAFRLPESVSPEVGLLAEPVAVVTHGWHRLEEKQVAPERLAVVGGGTIGLAMILLARARGVRDVAVLDTIPEKAKRGALYGARPVVVRPDDRPEQTAEKVEAALGGRPDVAIDAVGMQESFTLCVTLVAPGGSVLLIGNLAREVSLPLQTMVSNEWTLIGTYGFDRKAFSAALELLPGMNSELEAFIEGHCTLDETPQMMTALARGEKKVLKVVIQPQR